MSHRERSSESTDLGGHSFETLSAYVDAGRLPRDESIEASASAMHLVEGLERLRAIAPELISADTSVNEPVDSAWVQRIITGLRRDARAGRHIPLRNTPPGAHLTMTEGSLRGLIRAAERTVPGVLIARCTFHGDMTKPGASVQLSVEVSLPYGVPVEPLSQALRAEIYARIRAHTEMHLTAVHLEIRDVYVQKNSEVMQ